MIRSDRPQVPQIHRKGIAENKRDFKAVCGMQDKMHDYRMVKIRENLEESQKKNWIHVGNAFREQSLAPSKL